MKIEKKSELTRKVFENGELVNEVTLGDLNVHSKSDWNDYYTFIDKDPIAGKVLDIGEEYFGN